MKILHYAIIFSLITRRIQRLFMTSKITSCTQFIIYTCNIHEDVIGMMSTSKRTMCDMSKGQTAIRVMSHVIITNISWNNHPQEGNDNILWLSNLLIGN